MRFQRCKNRSVRFTCITSWKDMQGTSHSEVKRAESSIKSAITGYPHLVIAGQTTVFCALPKDIIPLSYGLRKFFSQSLANHFYCLILCKLRYVKLLLWKQNTLCASLGHRVFERFSFLPLSPVSAPFRSAQSASGSAKPERMALMAMAHSRRFRSSSQATSLGCMMSPLTLKLEALHPPEQ